MITLAIVFALVFVVGSAFALTQGELDMVSTVNIAAPDDLYVVWNNVVAPPVPFGFVVGATQTATIENARGRTAQRIVWTINFNQFDPLTEAVAAITATAVNNSTQTAVITGGTAAWTDAAGAALNPADFGLTVDIIGLAAFSGTLAPSAVSAPLTVEVEWDGTVPTGFTVPDGQTHGFAATLTIEFDYAPAP